ncbi:MAG: 3-hydroxyacyl-CoA dehydrogenase family protein [Pseudomonadota bacterium]
MSITNIAVIGAGTMGTGISIASAANGVNVAMVDVSDEQLERSRSAAEGFFKRQVDKGRLEAADADAALGRIARGTDLGAAGDAGLVIEAVFELLELKHEMYAKLMPIVGQDVIVASNTSALKIADLAKAIDDPSRFLGLHYFSPAEINPIVEVVRGEETAQAVMDACSAFLEATKKTPIPCKDQNGFAINRFFCPFTNEAVRAMEDGLGTPAQIDRVSRLAVGAAAGPFRVMNLVKPRINMNALRNLEPLGPFYAPADALVALGEAEGLWEMGEDQSDEPAEVAIVDRLRGATFLPVLELLDEDVAAAADVDTGASLALKFGKPPCALMDELGKDEVARLVAPIAARYGAPLPQSLNRVGTLVSG